MIAGLKPQVIALRDRVLSVPGVRRGWRATRLLAHGFRGEMVTLRASALTYLTLLSLVPLLAVLYAVVDLFTGEAAIHDRLQGYINSQLGIGAGAAIASAITTFTSKATVKTLGAIGFTALLFSVLSLLWNVESAFNHIYGVRRPRSVVQRLLKYWSFLTLGPLFLSASVYVTWQISRLQEGHEGHAHPHNEFLHTLAALSSVAITYAALGFLYKVLPSARVRVRSALVAAFTAGTAWEAAKFLFAWASGRMVQVHKIYGSVAVLPITLTWIYISWIIALVGCRFCFALDESRKPEPHPHLHGAAARETFVARLMLGLVQLHREGRSPVRSGLLCEEVQGTRHMVRDGMRALTEAGLVIEAKGGGWVPARDASRVTLAEVRAAARASVAHPSAQPDQLGEALARAFAAAEGVVEGTLAEPLDVFLARADPLVPVAQPARTSSAPAPSAVPRPRA